MTKINEILARFVGAMGPVGFDKYGTGWGNEYPAEPICRARLVAQGFDAFTANLLMEEALLDAEQGWSTHVGAHRAASTLTWQAGMSEAIDAANRIKVNAAYAASKINN